MQLRISFFILSFSLLSSFEHFLFAQTITYTPVNSIPVITENDTLTNAWTGGINSATVSVLDFNGDSQNDLLLFDRQVNRSIVLLAQNGKYVYAPELTDLLPESSKYVLFYDYNLDGKKDLFTQTTLGISVYKNVGSGTIPKFELFKDALYTHLPEGEVNMDISNLDVPALVDIDNDLDMDILHFRASSGSVLNLEQNISREKYGHSDSLEFKNTDNCWGGIYEASCTRYLFTDPNSCKNKFRLERLEHAGAGSVLAIDFQADGAKDLYLGKEDCDNLIFLQNKGTYNSPFFNTSSSISPSNLPNFRYPLTFYEDLDADGIKDLISTMGLTTPVNGTNLAETVSWFKNTGTNALPVFAATPQKNYLQNEMIDLGANTTAGFADEDGDGDLDMFISNATNDTTKAATISHFENTGSDQKAVFRLKTYDYLFLSSNKWRELTFTFSELNQDEKTDLIVLGTGKTKTMQWYFNTTTGSSFAFDLPNLSAISVENAHSLYFTDVNSDGLKDLLLGNNDGSISHFSNTGTGMTPVFSIVNAHFGGIGGDPADGKISCTTTDIDQDGKQDLVIANESGLVYYTDYKNQDPDNFSQKPIELAHAGFVPPSRHMRITATHLDTDRVPELIIGTTGGGLQYYQGKKLVTGLEASFSNPPEKGIKIFPNPTSGTFEVSLPEGGNIKISNIVGNILFYQTHIEAHTFHYTQTLPSGIYFVCFQGHSGQKACQKLIVK